MAERTNLLARIRGALLRTRALIAEKRTRQRRFAAGEDKPLLFVVEGGNDIEFLRRTSVILKSSDNTLPDLNHLERSGRLIFVPFGGDVRSWAFRLAELGSPEFHLYDREDSPASQIRYEVARTVNQRSGCRAAVTSKRSLENFLHPTAIFEARGVEVSFADDDDVANLVAEQCFLGQHPAARWNELSVRSRRRLRNKIKNWLNTIAVDRMTTARFAERDPFGEISSWLKIIGDMADMAS
jgi:hypothetical protein